MLRLARVSPAIWVAALTLGALIVADILLRHESGLTGDERFYTRMAAHPGGAHNFPYAYRIGVPRLVHILPVSHTVSFTAIALLAIAASSGALYALLKEFEIRSGLATAFALGFAVSPPLLVVLLRNGREIDPTTVLLLTLGSLFIVRRQKLALALVLLVGTTIHEACLFLIPFAYAVWATRLVDADAVRDAGLVAVLPLIIYVYLRTSVAAVGRQYIPGYSGSFLAARFGLVHQALASGTWQQELRRMASAYGPLWLTAPLALVNLPFARRGLVLVGLCIIAMTFAFDWGRIIFFAAPVFYVAAAHVTNHRKRLALATVIALFALDAGYALYMQAYGVQHGIETSTGVRHEIPVY